MQDILIRPYEDKDRTAIENIHDCARKTELALAGLAAGCREMNALPCRLGAWNYHKNFQISRIKLLTAAI